jgi:triosephosphate isomerase
VIIAYEPVWAIGTGKVATLLEIDHAHRFIATVWGEHGFSGTPVTLYGGSVNPGNFAEILTLAAVDGALVGGASLKLDQWQQLITIAEENPVAATSL